METGAAVLRPATSGDAEFLAWGLNEAAGGLFDSLLGKRARASWRQSSLDPFMPFRSSTR